MKYSIVYSSKTGNTAMLAERLRRCLPEDGLVYFGAPAPAASAANLTFVGFWTDKGTCCEDMARFLGTLYNQSLFLFGTAGFGGNPGYFAQILTRVGQDIDASNTIVGTYMCQGKMPHSVRRRYEAMQSADGAKAAAMLGNFDAALSHPDVKDLDRLEHAVRALIPDGSRR